MAPSRITIGDILRSITATTGALAGGLGIAVPILIATTYEMKFGRPSSTAGLAIPFALLWGGLGALLGGAVGRGIQQAVARSRWAGPMDLGLTVILLALFVMVPSMLAVREVRRIEAGNAPRVIRSAGEISRTAGGSPLLPVRSAVFLWVSTPHPDHPRGELRWNDRRVEVRVAEGELIVTAEGLPGRTVDISAFDYAREVYGVTAAVGGREWLALLVQLRASSGRDLLYIFNPAGALAHEELLERHRGLAPRVGLGSAGPDAGPQEIILDRGVPVRYHVVAR